jgi:hypothetical protein
MATMDSEVEIEVEFEVDLTVREDKVIFEVGVKFKLNLSFVLCNLLLARDSVHVYFWRGKLISLAKSLASYFWRGISTFGKGR